MPRVETWGFESARTDGTGVFVRLACFPDEGIAWYWAYVFLPDVGLAVVRDHEVPLPRRGLPDLEVRADSLWAELVCETPLEHWGLGLEAFGVILDDPWDARRGELGHRVPVGLDLEWETLAPPWRDPATGREHQAGRVHGELIVGTERVAIDGVGARDEFHGEFAGEWARQRAAFAIGEAVAAEIAVDDRGGLARHVWALGTGAGPVDRPLEVEADAVSFAVVPLAAGVDAPYLLKALIRVAASTDEGERSGAGFVEWTRSGPPLG